MFDEILGKDLPSISCFISNKLLFEDVHSTKILQDQHLHLDIASVQQAIHNNKTIIKWAKTQQQLAHAELQIRVGHWTMTGRNKCLTNLKLFQSDIVSKRKIKT